MDEGKNQKDPKSGLSQVENEKAMLGFYFSPTAMVIWRPQFKVSTVRLETRSNSKPQVYYL